jgi:hypothetical protein
VANMEGQTKRGDIKVGFSWQQAWLFRLWILRSVVAEEAAYGGGKQV